MPFEDTEILEFHQFKKSDQVAFIIYADLECIIQKVYVCKNNPENLSTTKLTEHIPSDFSMSTLSSFRSIENIHDAHRSKDCMKKFCEFLREHVMKIINFKKKKNEVINKKAKPENAKICYICKQKFENKYLKDKFEIFVIIYENTEVLRIAYII